MCISVVTWGSVPLRASVFAVFKVPPWDCDAEEDDLMIRPASTHAPKTNSICKRGVLSLF